MTALIFLASILAGAIAALAGFGIGSVLTPLLALSVGTKEAVVAVSIPHLVATAIRFWNLRHNIDHQVLKHFGIASAAGGLAGALIGSLFSSPILAYILGGLLVFAGLTGLTGISQKMRFGRMARRCWRSTSHALLRALPTRKKRCAIFSACGIGGAWWTGRQPGRNPLRGAAGVQP
jgi:uncharacterized membrane protein YfcA